MDSLQRQAAGDGKRYIYRAAIFIILFFSSSYYALIINANGIRNIAIELIATLIITFYSMIIRHSKVLITKKELSVYCVFLILPVIDIVRGTNIQQWLVIFVICLLSAMIVVSINYKTFIYSYNQVLLFLSVFSLCCLCVSLLIPYMIQLFPYIHSRGNLQLYNCIFSIGVTGVATQLRNYGVFWEPGAFQTFLVFAIIFDLFCIKDRSSLKRVIIFSITLLTTVSLTGYIALFIILLAAANSDSVISFEKKSKKQLFVIGCVVALIAVVIVVPDEAKNNMIDKISYFISPNNTTGSAAAGSAAARYNAIYIPLKHFIKSPIFGVGITEFQDINRYECASLATCTPVNWLTMYGFIWGGIFLLGLKKLANRLSRNKNIAVVLFLTMIISIISESYITSPLIYIFSLYSFKNED